MIKLQEKEIKNLGRSQDMLIADRNRKEHDDEAMKKRGEEAREAIAKENEEIRLSHMYCDDIAFKQKTKIIAYQEENQQLRDLLRSYYDGYFRAGGAGSCKVCEENKTLAQNLRDRH